MQDVHGLKNTSNIHCHVKVSNVVIMSINLLISDLHIREIYPFEFKPWNT